MMGVRPQALRAQARTELMLTLRRGESLLLTLGIPLALLVFFSYVEVLPIDTIAEDPVEVLAPGMIALAVMSMAFTGLAIATGFERRARELRRLGVTPLGRRGLVAAKVLAVLAVEVVQIFLLVVAAKMIGWSADPRIGDFGEFVASVLLATAAFAGLALWMAGTLRAETTLAAANGVWLVLLLTSGMLVPLGELPGGLRWVSEALPAAPFTTIVTDALSATAVVDVEPRHWIVLAAWAVVAPAIAVRRFTWDQSD